MEPTKVRCQACEREHEVPSALRGERLLCECGSHYRVSDRVLRASIQRDEDRTSVARRKQVESLSQQVGLGFPFVGLGTLAVALSLTLTYGSSGLAIAGFLVGGWFVLLGGLFRLTNEIYFAWLAAGGWFLVSLPVIFLGLSLLLVGLPGVGLIVAMVAAVFASVLPLKVVRELGLRIRELEEREDG